MPATTPEQQRLMAQAYELKKGNLKPEDVNPNYLEQIQKLADSMTLQQLKDFASTKHSDMPKRPVKEYAYFWWDTQGQQASDMATAIERDRRDPLVQRFMDFVAGKKSKKLELEEDFAAPAASVTNTPGMGNVSPAAPGKIGSGDILSGSSTRKKRKKKLIEGYDSWLENK